MPPISIAVSTSPVITKAMQAVVSVAAILQVSAFARLRVFEFGCLTEFRTLTGDYRFFLTASTRFSAASEILSSPVFRISSGFSGAS